MDVYKRKDIPYVNKLLYIIETYVNNSDKNISFINDTNYCIRIFYM